MNSEVILLHLSLIDGIGPVTIKKFLYSILKSGQDLEENKVMSGFDLQDLYTLKQIDFCHIFGLQEKIAYKLYLGLKDIRVLEKEVGLITKHNIRFVTLLSKDYPELLKNIYAPPSVLYVKSEKNVSDILQHQKKIAFVGARKAHKYGERFIDNVIPEMVKNNWIIVSGGAIGADSMAHAATVKSGGRTIAVIGSGLLHPYPQSNKKLFEDIIVKGGALISPFSLSTVARPGNFPARNRIIAGLSLGCVVVQAAKKSGASITAQFALDQGREVFAVPGSVDDELSLGCHMLIQQGAKLVSCTEDILSEFADYISPKIEPEKKSIEKPHDKNLKIFEISKSLQSKQEVCNVDTSIYKKGSIEDQIIVCCTKQPCAIDQIAVATNKSMHELHEILFDMQISGDIVQNHAGMFEKA